MKQNMTDRDREEIAAVRHVGTVCAGALAIMFVLKGDASISWSFRVGAAMLLIGVCGSALYQLTTIRGDQKLPNRSVFTIAYAGMVMIGALGFLFIAIALLVGA